jgi:hypothetical protein
MRNVSSWLVIMALGMPGAAGASPPVLEVDPGDNPLAIYGKLDGQTTAFGGNVRLTVTGSDVKELLLLSSGMKRVGDDSVIIDRSNVTVPSGISLTDGQPRDVRVTVNNVTRPGEYAGSLKFVLPGQSEKNAVEIGLKLRIEAKPRVQPVFPNMTFQLVRCRSQIPFDCRLATWLLSGSAISNDWVVYFDNQTLSPVDITDATVVMRGEKTGHAVGPGEIEVSHDPNQPSALPHSLPAAKVEPITMTIHRDQLSADRYQGTLRFKVKGSDDPVTINADLNLRDGPVVAVLIVLVGIIIGRLARGMSTPEAQKQIRFLPRLYQLDASVHSVQNAKAREYLGGQIQDARERIRSAKETEEVLSQVLDKLKGRIEFLIALERLEDDLAKGLAALKPELQPKIEDARSALIAGQTEEAERLRKEVNAGLQRAQQDGSAKSAPDQIESARKSFSASAARWFAAENVLATAKAGGKHLGWLVKVMATLSGTEMVGAQVRYWLVRPLLFLVLLVALALLGLQTLYVNAGSTFGAAGLYDYLGLFLWGLSADVVQRTLQNLQVPKQG